MKISLFIAILQICLSDILPADSFVWNWRDAVLMKSFIEISRSDESRRAEVEEYVSSAMTRLATQAHGRHPNGVASACGLAFLKEIGRNTPETDAALERVYRQYKEIPRSANGACSHRPGRVELWDDTLYMLDIFLLECWRATGDASYIDMLAEEVIAHAVHLRDQGTGLWYHGWAESGEAYDDACCQKAWNANPLHRNTEFWGRGNGWVAMCLVDLLEVLPSGHPRRPAVEEMFTGMMKSVRKLQNRRTGLWYQLPARPSDKGNFLEASCTAMFGYALAKGCRIGVLNGKSRKAAVRALKGLDRYCMKNAGSKDVVLEGVCEGTCIGDRAYYYSRRRKGGETYAMGAYLLLSNEILNNK